MSDINENLEKAADEGIRIIRKFFREPSDDKAVLAAVKAAQSMVGAWSRVESTDSARATLAFNMARELAADKEDLRRYLAAALPSSPITKALPEPAKE